ncbi:MAG: D-alanine--D-alanine ligase [Rickettsiaceae bacterium]|nr:D-alanine--D-alanine ligase [Rickettsiaceae bacterium]
MQKFKTTYRENSEISELTNSGSKHVVLLVGGMSAEREVSLSSGEGVAKSLISLGYKVTRVDMGADIASVLSVIKPDVVFNCLHGTYGEDGCVPGLLNILQIPYTHSGVLASSLAFDKIKSKDVFKTHGILTPPDRIVSREENLKIDPMKRPYVIKPISQGSSVGVEIIFEGDDFDFANYDFEYGDKIIVEKYVKGRELQIAVLDGKPLDVLEIKLLNKRFYDYEAKYTEGFTEHILPAKIPEEIYKKALDISKKAYDIFGCRGMVRVEILYSEDENELYILELNTHPGMTPLSICPEIAAYNGISFEEQVRIHVEEARVD